MGRRIEEAAAAIVSPPTPSSKTPPGRLVYAEAPAGLHRAGTAGASDSPRPQAGALRHHTGPPSQMVLPGHPSPI